MENQNKSNKTKIIITVIVIFGVLFLGFIIFKENKKQYELSPAETLKEVREFKHVISPEQFIEILYSKDSIYQFIDLRNPKDFIKGHLEGAINIPVHKILDAGYQNILNQDKKINILYHSNHVGACSPWMLLMQLGYKNNKILLGGYDYVFNHIINKFQPLSGNYSNEKPLYDYAKIMNELGGSSNISISDESKQQSAPVTRPKEKKKGGGC